MAEITRKELLARYKAGERDFSGLDFSGLDLSGIKDEEMRAEDGFLKGDYSLNRCIFRGANFSYVDFSKWTCIEYCDFRDAILFGANLSCCSFSGANFTGADMRSVTFDSGEGIGVIFENTNFTGAKGSFPHEGTLCLRNCIGMAGEFIELFNEETVRRDSYRRFIEERHGISLEEFERIPVVKKINPDAEIPF